MSNTKTYSTSLVLSKAFALKVTDYVMLTKLKLSLVVVFSSILGYAIVAQSAINWVQLVFLALGGFLVTAAANTLNQVLEKDFDVLMSRTANRPLAAGRMKTSEAVMFAGICCLIGISILSLFNPVTALLGMLSLIIYAFVYTPLKRYSTLAVAVGAIPGALPVMIGATAFEGSISFMALSLFIVQFLWQFPHFWAIGFLSFEDYQKGGFKLLPEQNGQIERSLGMSATLYALMILPVIGGMFYLSDVSALGTAIVSFLSVIYIVLSYNFHRSFNRASALKLMFYSFFYLPFVLLSYWLI